MKRIAIMAIGSFLACSAVSAQKIPQPAPAQAQATARPKLVIGIVIDQMRWDYLYRFNPLFKPEGGFKRMMGEGFSCDNTLVPYAPTVTACGHTCVYTGSVPAIHGIIGNDWWDNLAMKNIYCSEDKTVNGVGSKSAEEGQMSPRNMLTTTICDELRIATNFKSKVIGIALKDRGSILPAGHSANAAYWYESKSGNFISSTYYMNALPEWVNNFNNRKLADSMYTLGWNISLPKEVYTQYATDDAKPYETKALNRNENGFPYTLSGFIGSDYGKIATTPYGNTLTAEMAKAAIIAEKLGQGSATDFLAISFSSPDYIGHAFGPNSWEIVDNYVRLDEELGKLFVFLDATVGKGQYSAFLTADHAVAHVPAFLTENKLPGGLYNDGGALRDMNARLKEKYGIDHIVSNISNYQVYLDHNKIDSAAADEKRIKQWIIKYLMQNEAVVNVMATADLIQAPLNSTLRDMLVNGYFPKRSGDIQIIIKPGYLQGGATGTSHGLWYKYDSHIPLLWYGWGIKKGSTNRETYMTDIAGTLASLLHIQMPNGSIGKVIPEVMK